MCKNIWQLVLFSISSLAVLLVSPADVIHAETTLRPDTINSGSVEVSADGENWTPFSQDHALKAGDSIRTGGGSAVSLKAEDGSVLYLEEQTILKIAELTFSTIDRARIFRFSLERGTLTAKAARVGSKANVFEVKTRSVLVRLQQDSPDDMEASVKIIANPPTTPQSKATLLASASDSRELLIANILPPIGSTGSTGASEDPFATKVQPFFGKFDIEQLNNEKTLIEMTVGSGVSILLERVGQSIRATINGQTIELTTTQGSVQYTLVPSNENNSMQLSQAVGANAAGLQVENNSIQIGENSSMILTVPQDSVDRGFTLTLSLDSPFSVTFSQDPSAEEGITITTISGNIQVNGQELPQGQTMTIEGDEETQEDTEGEAEPEKTPKETSGETLVEPPSSESSSSGSTGASGVPTEPKASPIQP